MTIITFIIVFSFASLKFHDLIVRKNPLVTKFDDRDALELDDSWWSSEHDFMMAFAVDSYSLGTRTDPHVLKWVIAHTIGSEGGETRIDYYATKKCTQ